MLLIESGHRDDDKYIHIPATFFKVIEKGRDALFYASEPEKGLNGRPSIVPQGHTLGGGSSINAMVYIRGSRQDYDTWAQMGCSNWSYDKVLPVFRDLENNQRLSGEFHGASGELTVSDRPYRPPALLGFHSRRAGSRLALQRGLQRREAGRRWLLPNDDARRTASSSAEAFLRKAEGRPNLTIRTPARAFIRSSYEGRRAVGVRLEDGTLMAARREVVLTAGALATPKILQLSGIGPAAASA